MTAFLAGLGLWTLLEYLLHRFVFHDRVLGRAAAAGHLEHHAKVDWFVPWPHKLALAVVILAALSVVTVPLAGLGAGIALAAGIVTGWLAYEALHRAIHVRAPRTAYGRWARRHHLHHHFVDPAANHGVSSPIWDLVFGTFRRVDTVRVPPRQAGKLPWLLVDGRIAPGLEDTYVLHDPPRR
jgi:sterol desaturase/sphingolipid hydroxylase (fatty acid hydroxylase superfamily)